MRTAGVEPARGKAQEVDNLPRLPISSRPPKMRPRVLATLGRTYLSNFLRWMSSYIRGNSQRNSRTLTKTSVLLRLPKIKMRHYPILPILDPTPPLCYKGPAYGQPIRSPPRHRRYSQSRLHRCRRSVDPSRKAGSHLRKRSPRVWLPGPGLPHQSEGRGGGRVHLLPLSQGRARPGGLCHLSRARTPFSLKS